MRPSSVLLATAQELTAALSLDIAPDGQQRGRNARSIAKRRQHQQKAAAQIARGGCRCGNEHCDCAKWERIFKAKFEDPTYYSTPGPNFSAQSSLREW